MTIALPKAYLAHSSTDKPYVRRVAERLGRARVVFDEMVFEPAVDFRDSIQRGLDTSQLFVLFASRASLDSTWVRFELAEADRRRIRQSMKVMAFIIDDNLTHNDLPEWMRDALVPSSLRPQRTASIIQGRLLSLVGSDSKPPFVGRERDLESISLQFLAAGGATPRIVVLSGLQGVGRRTLLTHASRNLLSVDPGPIVNLRDSDSVDVLHRQLFLDATDDLRPEALRDAQTAFAAGADKDRGQVLASLVAQVARPRGFPMIVDNHNALLTDDGNYIPTISMMLDEVVATNDLYLGLVHRRRPWLDGLSQATRDSIVWQRVEPLAQASTEVLLQQAFREVGVVSTVAQLSDLSPFVNGYPPAVQLAATYARLYGLDTVLADKRFLIDLQAGAFQQFLNSVSPTDRQWQLIRVLAGEQALPLEAISVAIDSSTEDIAADVRHLVDLNVLSLEGSNLRLSPPLRYAVERDRGLLGPADYAAVAKRLTERYWAADSLPPTSVLTSIVHAHLRAGPLQDESIARLLVPSDLYAAAMEEYQRKSYDRALALADSALSLDQSHLGARRVRFKTLVRKERWHEADAQLRELGDARPQELLYLRGFMLQKRGDLDGAASAFQAAYDSGDRSVQVLRDLAHARFRQGRFRDAQAMLDGLPEPIKRNRFVVDLAIQVAIATRNFPRATAELDVLRRVDVPTNVKHREAQLLAARGHYDDALVAARSAVATDSPRFEALAQVIDLLIELNRFGEAQVELDRLPAISAVNRDIRTGLAVKLLAAQGKWREASAAWSRLVAKSSPIAARLRAQTLTVLLASRDATADERTEATAELAAMGDIAQAAYIADDDDDD